MFGFNLLLWSLMSVASANTCDVFDFLPSPQTHVSQVRQYAFDSHQNQHYGHIPYAAHLEEIVDVLREFGFRDIANRDVATLHMSAYLYDFLENTQELRPEQVSDIVSIAGSDVADIVVRVTDDKTPHAVGETLKASSFAKMRGHRGATLTKLATQIAKVRFAQKHAREQFHYYKSEYPGFRLYLYAPGIADEMWTELDRLMGQ